MNLTLVVDKPKRGRPRGSVKNETDKLRDEIRTVATMNELLIRAPAALNTGNFSRWFDKAMHQRHPRLIFNTEFSNKWRRNFQGRAALIAESIDHLQELFPDGRAYLAGGDERAESEVVHCLSDSPQQNPGGAVPQEHFSARAFFEEGPGRLWSAIWAHEDSIDQLWEIYASEGGFANWRGDAADFGEIIDDLEQEFYSKFDLGETFDYEDLGRAIVLYRLNSERRGTACDGMRLYLCVRLAFAEVQVSLDVLGVKEKLLGYLIGLELDRQLNDDFYVDVLEWKHQRLSEFDRRAYAENPFLFQRSDVAHVARRNEMLAQLAM